MIELTCTKKDGIGREKNLLQAEVLVVKFVAQKKKGIDKRASLKENNTEIDKNTALFEQYVRISLFQTK